MIIPFSILKEIFGLRIHLRPFLLHEMERSGIESITLNSFKSITAIVGDQLTHNQQEQWEGS